MNCDILGTNEAPPVENWRTIRRLIGHDNDVQDLGWSYDSSILVSVGLDSKVVVWSGLVEMAAGASLLLFPRQRKALGWALAGLYVAIFPGNLAQWKHNRDAFGLDTDEKRFARLFGQPVLVAWALWSTGALNARRSLE